MPTSGGDVRSIWGRHNLENCKKRLRALEEKVADEGIILSDVQVVALEEKKHGEEAFGEIETVHPGYLASQDTFLVGNSRTWPHLPADLRRHIQYGSVL